MSKSRCGVADFGKTDNMGRKKRYILQGTYWKKKVMHLGYPLLRENRETTHDSLRMFLFVFLVGKSGFGYFKIQLYPPTVFLIFLYVKSRLDLVCETVREFSCRSRTREGSTNVLERSVGENRAKISPKTNFKGKAHFLKSKLDSYSFPCQFSFVFCFRRN